MSGMTSERLAEIRERDKRIRQLLSALGQKNSDIGEDRTALLAHVDHLTAENVTLRHAYMAHAEVCDHDEPTVLGQLDNARQNVLDLTAENARLRAGIAALHGAVQEFEPCPDGPWGCGELTCTESVHTGERYHDDQPTGRVCLTCRYEDGEPHDWPCETAALLNPPTEGETDAR